MSSISTAHQSVVRSASSLQRRFLLGAGLGGTGLILVLAWGADLALDRFTRRETEARLDGAAQRAQLLVDQSLADRERQVEVLALNPAVIDAAREGGARAASLKLADTPTPELEQRFLADRSLQVAPATRSFLLGVLPRLDAADMSITEGHGFNVLTTRRTSDFVQGDEAFWQSAWQDGLATSGTAYDSTLHRSVVSVAAVVKDGSNRLGVLTLAFHASPLVDGAGEGGRRRAHRRGRQHQSYRAQLRLRRPRALPERHEPAE